MDKERGILGPYYDEIDKISLLTIEEEVELGRRIKEEGDIESIHKLVKHNLKFVIKEAKKARNIYRGVLISFIDLVQEGTLGLYDAAYEYDYTRGFKFITYASDKVRRRMQQYFYKHSNSVHIPENQIELLRDYSKNKEILSKKISRVPTDKELANFMGVETSYLVELKKLASRDIFLESPKDGNTKTDSRNFKDTIPDNSEGNTDKRAMNGLTVEIEKESFHLLNEREREITERFFGINGRREETLQEIGDSMNLTRERIRQIKEEALHKIRRDQRYRRGKPVFNENSKIPIPKKMYRETPGYNKKDLQLIMRWLAIKTNHTPTRVEIRRVIPESTYRINGGIVETFKKVGLKPNRRSNGAEPLPKEFKKRYGYLKKYGNIKELLEEEG